MKFLQDLLALQKKPAESKIVEARAEEVGDYLDSFIDQEKMYHFEGPRGVRYLEQIIKTLGYHDLDYFLQDNSGCLEVMIEWIKSQRNQEWVDSIKSEIHDPNLHEDATTANKVRMLRTQLDAVNKQLDVKQQSGQKVSDTDPLKKKALLLQQQIDQLNGEAVTESKAKQPKEGWYIGVVGTDKKFLPKHGPCESYQDARESVKFGQAMVYGYKKNGKFVELNNDEDDEDA
jgi:hypothetical protein